jgi:D-inositol-3-phosphate glycosyltransferase
LLASIAPSPARSDLATTVLILTRKRYGISTQVPVVLFVGRLVPKKGFQKLIEARGDEYEIVFAGPGRQPNGVPAGLRFLGPVERAEIRDLYLASDILAFPAAGEMLTLVMQEAMACGLPVVATAEEDYSWYDLDPSGIALVPSEPKALRAAFLAILNDPDRMKRMQEYSRSLAESRFDWQKNVSDLASEYMAAAAVRPG